MCQVAIPAGLVAEIEGWLLAEGLEEAPEPTALRGQVQQLGACPNCLVAELTDEALAVAVRRRWFWRETCGELARRYGDRLRWWLLGFGADHALADDLSQDLLLRCFRGLRTFRPSIASFSAYFGRMASNAYVSSGRARRPQGLEAAEERPAPGAGPEEAALLRELAEQVEAALLALPQPLRTVLRLTMQGNSSDEIAEQTGLSLQAVYRQRFQGRRKLETLLELGPTNGPSSNEREGGM